MPNDTYMKALFAQQRAQIIFMKSMNPDLISDAYAYAWTKGLYPYIQSGDRSVPDLPHENFEKYFIISEKFAMEVLDYLDDLWMKKTPLTFYELEDKFGGKGNRSKLLKICRYAYLDNAFDKGLWDALLTPQKHPSEASSLTKDFDKTDLYLC